jgi:hypothetical protein
MRLGRVGPGMFLVVGMFSLLFYCLCLHFSYIVSFVLQVLRSDSENKQQMTDERQQMNNGSMNKRTTTNKRVGTTTNEC